MSSEVERFYADYRLGVFRYLRRVVGATETAKDLTQEVFLRVSRAGVPETTEIGQRAWVFQIARNLALNHLRDDRRRPATVAMVHPVVPATQELAAALHDAIERLPELDRDVFILRETAGLSYQEIADACELDIENVRARLHRVRQTLRESLGSSLRLTGQRGVRCLPAGATREDD